MTLIAKVAKNKNLPSKHNVCNFIVLLLSKRNHSHETKITTSTRLYPDHDDQSDGFAYHDRGGLVVAKFSQLTQL